MGRSLFFVLCGMLLVSCHKSEKCRNVTTSEAASPNGELKALTFRRFCPEQHSVSTDVSILRAGEELADGHGNVFAYEEAIPIRVAWLNDRRLAVYTYADPAKGTRIERAGNVAVEYSQVVETYLITPREN